MTLNPDTINVVMLVFVSSSIQDVPKDIDNIVLLHEKECTCPQAVAVKESKREYRQPLFCPCDTKGLQSLDEVAMDSIVATLDPLEGKTCLIGGLAPLIAHIFALTRQSSKSSAVLPQEEAAFAQDYCQKKFSRFLKRNPLKKYNENVFGLSQPTESELRHLFAVGGIKSVLNLRQMSEVGRVGFGMLAREEKLCADIGLTYSNVGVLSAEWEKYVEPVGKVLPTLPKPVLVHCQSRGRVDKILAALGINID